MSEEKVKTTIDKSKWPKGPWQNEPDVVEWVDDATGFKCQIKRHRLFGHLRGYVGVSINHPIFLTQNFDALKVHGGVTYNQRGAKAPHKELTLTWFGFDCAHANDLIPNALNHPDDVYRTIDFVKSECASLARQLAATEGTKL